LDDIVNRDTGFPTKIVGPSTRGGKPLAKDQSRRPGVVLIDPGTAHATELDLSQLESGQVRQVADAVDQTVAINKPSDLAHNVVQKLAREQRTQREAFQFFEPISGQENRAPVADSTPEIPMPAPRPATKTQAPAPPANPAPAAPREPLFQVVFERENGDSFEVFYHDVILSSDGGFITMARDRNSGPGVNFRSGSTEEPIRVTVTRLQPRSHAVPLVCLPTGFQLQHRGWDYTVFVVQEEASNG
jgi:hypothetical protein